MSLRRRGSESRFPTPWSWRLTHYITMQRKMGRVSSCSSFKMRVAPIKKFCEECLCLYILSRFCFPDEVSQCALDEKVATFWTPGKLMATPVQGYLVYWGSILSHTPLLSLTIPDTRSNVECQMIISSSASTKPCSLGELAHLHTLCLIHFAPQMEHAKPPCLLHEVFISNIPLTEIL